MSTSINVNVQQHPASVDAYIRHGWFLVPIPPGTKGPRQRGWNAKENTLRSQSDLLPGYGIGLAHAYSGTMALDIDVWARAAEELAKHNIDLNALYNAPDAVIVHTGRPGHGKLLYAMPEGKPLRSKKLLDTDPATDKRYNYIDFRCATIDGLTMQDVLPPSIHPDTQQPYSWSGYGHWTRLPLIPDALLTMWQSLLVKDDEKIIASGEPFATSWVEIESALETISPDCSRDEWIHVGMALQWAGTQTNDTTRALWLWNKWSSGSKDKYPGEHNIVIQWRSFRPDKVQSIKIGTLFHYARTMGWERPAPDVAALFAALPASTSPEDILTELRPTPPDIDLSLIPDVLARRAKEISTGIGCDPLVPLFAGLAAVSGAADARTRLELMPRFKVPPVLWLMTIGDPSQKKSPGSKPMFEPLAEFENEDKGRYARDILAWEGKEAAHEMAKKAFTEYASSPEGLLNPAGAPFVPELPTRPVPVRITVNDITSQKLVRSGAERPRGLLCTLDEMNGWCRKLGDIRGGEDRSAWVVSYEASRYEMDRVGSGTILADNLAVSIYGNMQPQVLRDSMKNLSADGLLQRFIPAVLRKRRWGIGNPLPDYLSNIGQWEQTLRIVYALPPQTYRLSDDAHQVYREFQRWFEQAKQDEEITLADDTFMTAFGKLEGTVGRLALVLHLVEAPFSPTLSADLMTRVVQIAKTFIVPAYRYSLTQFTEEMRLEKWIIDFLVRRGEEYPTITLVQLRREMRTIASRFDASKLDVLTLVAMQYLERAGWVIRVDDGSREHQRFAMWAVKQTLASDFKAYRRNVIEAKQRLMDSFYLKVGKNPPAKRIRGWVEEFGDPED